MTTTSARCRGVAEDGPQPPHTVGPLARFATGCWGPPLRSLAPASVLARVDGNIDERRANMEGWKSGRMEAGATESHHALRPVSRSMLPLFHPYDLPLVQSHFRRRARTSHPPTPSNSNVL